MSSNSEAASEYFAAITSALDGLDTFLREDESPLYKHDLIGAVIEDYLALLRNSLDSWQNRIAFAETFKVSQAESGFPAYRNVLELENDRKEAEKQLAAMPTETQLRQEMVDYILTKKAFPGALQKSIAHRRYMESVGSGSHFAPFVLPKTLRVSVNPKTKRPFYVVHWGYYDGSANLPMVYIVSLEDSNKDMIDALVSPKGKLRKDVNIQLPVEGLLNPSLAHQFDDFCEKNSAYSLTLSTIATNMDKDFDFLHPTQLRRFVLGPFYHADITVHGATVDKILQKVRRKENQWLMTWTAQEIYSMNEKPAKWGLWGGEPARNEYYINTDDLDCARMGVSSYQRNALVPHDAYQAIYAAGEADKIFDGYETHIVTGSQVLRRI
ncbi:MAG: hypothetical protein AAF362_04890 [Pseudomonadota bacterium]